MLFLFQGLPVGINMFIERYWIYGVLGKHFKALLLSDRTFKEKLCPIHNHILNMINIVGDTMSV